MTLLLDDQNGQAPTTQGAQFWIDQFNLSNVYVVADPSFSLVPGNSVGTPQLSVVDPRTMQVVYLQEGYSGSSPSQLVQLAQQNSGP